MRQSTTSSTSSSSSPPGFQTSDFPSLSVGKFDFPSLGGNKSESSSEATNQKNLLATPWARVVKSSDVKAVNINCDRVQASPLPSTSSDIKEEKDKVVEMEEEDNNDDDDDKEDEVTQVPEDLTLKQEEEEEEVFEEEVGKVVDAKNIETGEVCGELSGSETEVKSS